MTSWPCLLALLVSVIVVIGVVLPKCPSQSQRRATFKKLHAYSPASALLLSFSLLSVATLLLLIPTQSSHPMNHDNIDCGHQHRRGRCTPHNHCCGARCCRDNRAVEDSVCQAEEGVVQVALGVSTVTSFVLLLLRGFHCRRRR